MPFRLYANCVAVRGARRALICDLQRHRHFPVPLSLVDTLERHRDHDREAVYAAHDPGDHVALDEYFAFLEREELGWWCDEPERFPALDLSWDHPSEVTNAIVDTGASSDHDYAAIFAQLDALGCRHLQLRFFAPVTLARLDQVLACCDRGGLRSVEVYLPFTAETDDDALGDLVNRHPRVISVFCHSAPERRMGRPPHALAALAYHPDPVTSATHCGYVHPAYFVTTLPLFAESQSHNSCLNRKVSVDEHGEVRNCPAMPRSFGPARAVRLADVVRLAEFREPWAVSKDQVEVCRDCEFRHVCTDCRALLADPRNPRSKPARCGYDPYTATWSRPPAPGQLASVSTALPVRRAPAVRELVPA